MWPLEHPQGISLIWPSFLPKVTQFWPNLKFHQDKHSDQFSGQLRKKCGLTRYFFIWPSDLVFYPWWPKFKLIFNLSRQPSDQISGWLNEQDLWLLQQPHGTSLIWPRDLVFDLRWPKFDQKPFDFHTSNPSSRKPSDNMRNSRFTSAQVDTDGKQGLFLHGQLAHLHTENTQMKLHT